MSHRKKNSNDLSRFLRYSGNRMKGKERNAFEKELQKDPFDAEAAEGFSIATSKEIEKDLQEISRRLKMQNSRRTPVFFFRIAAVVTLIIASTITMMLMRTDHKQPLVSENIRSESKESLIAVPAAPSVTKVITPSTTLITKSDEPQQEKHKEVSSAVPVVEMNRAMDKADIIVSGVEIAANEEQRLAGVKMAEASSRAKPSDIRNGKGAVRKIEGTVISEEDNLPIPGAAVKIKGTKRGVISDIDGRFTINVENDSSLMLVAEFIGMKPQEFSARPDTNLLIAMNADMTSLDEVVVVAYGISKSGDEEEEYDTHISPKPVTGAGDFKKYIKENLIYPSAIVKKTREVVVISMMVRSNGSIENITVVRSPGQAFSEEAIRLIKDGPQWNPATVDGITQNEEVKVRLVFDERE